MTVDPEADAMTTLTGAPVKGTSRRCSPAPDVLTTHSRACGAGMAGVPEAGPTTSPDSAPVGETDPTSRKRARSDVAVEVDRVGGADEDVSARRRRHDLEGHALEAEQPPAEDGQR